MRSRSSGFTLVELVVVITILGILAAFAVPRFISLENQARIASVQGLAGSVRSASALARGMSMASGATDAIQMEGQTIKLSSGYPAAGSIPDTLADMTGFTVKAGDPTTLFLRDGATDPEACSVSYTQPAAAGEAPVIVVTTKGC